MSEQTVQNTIPLTRIQKLIGKLMFDSKINQPSFYMQVNIDMTELVGLRKAYCKEVGVRVSTNDFIMCAMAKAAADYPLFAGKIDEHGENIIIAEQIGVGLAVAAPQGLVVPVIKDASEKTLPQIANEAIELLNKARANKLGPDDFDGANVVLSGLGMYGVDSFYAIAPPGATAIISIGTIDDTAVPMKNTIVTRRMMSTGLAANIKIVDEAYAARFLTRVKDILERPRTLTE
jgi:pyruvate dehydrogenase E2 component (dihydrolipoamide acetyltransferase)